MATHEIELGLPAATTIFNSDARIRVYSDGVVLGTLEVSRGSIDWRPGRGKKVRRLTWEQFGTLMRSEGKPV